MALLENIYKVVVKSGLVGKSIKYIPVISFLVSVVGVGWLCVLPQDGSYRNTYISENALMPSQAYSYFRESEWNILRGFRSELVRFEEDGLDVERNLKTIEEWFIDIGYKTAIHHSEYGDNLYAVWHAPRGDDTEAMVLVAPFYNSEGRYNVGGLSTTIALARYFYRWGIWSKNIIIVIPQEPNHALRAWALAYHSSLDLTGGEIESAVVLDYASKSDNFEYIELYYEGVNGQLPNLDLVNIAVSISEHEGPRISLQHTPQSQLRQNNYFSRLRVLFRTIVELSLAGLKPGHGNEAFSGFRIQAITLKAMGESGPFDITTFGRIPEAIFRSINNLLEKFHQSFFFYFLLAPRNFVSIGTYLPSAAAICASFILSSLDLVLNSTYSTHHLLKHLLPSLFVLVVNILVGIAVLMVTKLSAYFTYLWIVLSVVLLAAFRLIRVNVPAESATMIKSISLLFFASSLFSLLVLNFSLTFTLGLLALPLSFNFKSASLRLPCLVVSNPFLQLLVVAYFEFDGDLAQLSAGLISNEFNCLTWYVLTICWLPTWLSVYYSGLAPKHKSE